MEHDETNKVVIGKIKYSLVDFGFEEGLAAALTNGLTKYTPCSWRNVEPVLYHDALKRHLMAHFKAVETGSARDFFDTDSGLLHLDHAAACLMFLHWFTLQWDPVGRMHRTNLKNKTFARKPEVK